MKYTKKYRLITNIIVEMLNINTGLYEMSNEINQTQKSYER